MSYGNFSTYEEVATKFRIKLREVFFVQEKEFAIKPDILEFIKENLSLRRNYITENAICESIISPILTVVSKNNNLPREVAEKYIDDGNYFVFSDRKSPQVDEYH